MDTAAHWDGRFRTTGEADRSWSQDVPADSLHFIDLAGTRPGDAVVDVGGGASRLVDELLGRGHTDLTVIDLSQAALDEAAARVGPAGSAVRWVAADVTHWEPARSFRLWHDRAVFHFLVDPADQEAYVATATAALEPGGHLVVATFAPGGPEQCSGLDVQRWSTDDLVAAFPAFDEVVSEQREHHTPWGSVQPFSWVLLRRR
jgi:trans-aconitate methyltransferase